MVLMRNQTGLSLVLINREKPVWSSTWISLIRKPVQCRWNYFKEKDVGVLSESVKANISIQICT